MEIIIKDDGARFEMVAIVLVIFTGINSLPSMDVRESMRCPDLNHVGEDT